MQLTEHFSLQDFTRSQAAIRLGIDNTPTPQHLANIRNLATHMEQVRSLFNRHIEITSGYRSREVNAAVGGAPDSSHTLGHAANFRVEGFEDLRVAEKIRDSTLNFDQLILMKGHGIHISFHPGMRRQILNQPGGLGAPIYAGLDPSSLPLERRSIRYVDLSHLPSPTERGRKLENERDVRSMLEDAIKGAARHSRFSEAAVEVLFALLVERHRRGDELDDSEVKYSVSRLAQRAAKPNRSTVNSFDVVRTIGGNWCNFPPFCDRVP